MRRLFLLASLVLVSAVPLRSQSALDTVNWIKSFIAEFGGSVEHVYFDDEVVSRSRSAIMPLVGVKKVASWSHTDSAVSHFVRITGTLYDCSEVDGWNGVADIQRKCSGSPGTLDITLQQGSVRSEENCTRLVKAITHLAEMNGAKVNGPELF